MRRDDRDDPFDEFFEEIERMMNQMMGDAGEFRIEQSGSFGPQGGDAAVHYDVHETDDELRLVADLPGVEDSAIDLQCDGEVLTIDAEGPERAYNERIRLPSRVDEHSADASYNNGVLEVIFQRATDSTSIDV